MLRIHAFVSGKVQGVYFRQSAKTEADRLGITGFAKNLDDGRVEVVAEGPSGPLSKFVGFLHSGPEKARVEKVIARKEKHSGEFSGFEVR